jgi:hypothetical protein
MVLIKLKIKSKKMLKFDFVVYLFQVISHNKQILEFRSNIVKAYLLIQKFVFHLIKN